MKPSLLRRSVSEFLGSAMLLAAVVGSGIMAERLSAGNIAVALLANSLATGAALIAIILAFESISGPHLNPVVTLADSFMGGLPWKEAPLYIVVQCAGAIVGVAATHIMFGLPLLTASTHVRSGPAQVFSEFLATFGLLAIIWGCVSRRPAATPYAVGAYITAAYWFTSSTSFANPAVTLARCLTDTFAGIRPTDALPFMAAQLLGAIAATLLFRWLAGGPPTNPTDRITNTMGAPSIRGIIADGWDERMSARCDLPYPKRTIAPILSRNKSAE